MSIEEYEEEFMDLSKAEIQNKYIMATNIAGAAMVKVTEACKADAKIVDICDIGDKFITAETAKKGKAYPDKGVAFPTCISVNNCCGHMSPFSTDTAVLKIGDMVKIDLGVQIDGYAVLTAKTIIIPDPAKPEEEVKGPKADVIAAAATAMNAAMRMIRPGKTNEDVTEVIKRVAEAYHVNAVEGVLSHRMRKFVIDDTNVIMNRSLPDQRVEKCEFEVNDVWGIDIMMSTGEGIPREDGVRTTIFKRIYDNQYSCKIRASRYLLADAGKRFATFPFTLRAFDEKQAKLGLRECLAHDLLDTYPVLYEKPGCYVAQFKTTVLVLPNRTFPVFEPLPQPNIKSSYVVEDAMVKEALALSTKPKKASKKKAAKKKAAAAATAEAPKTEEAKPEEAKAEEKK